jgi:hypothetical protein
MGVSKIFRVYGAEKQKKAEKVIAWLVPGLGW